jgi:hypothetical protein
VSLPKGTSIRGRLALALWGTALLAFVVAGIVLAWLPDLPGFLFSRPVALAAFAELLVRR